MLKPHPLDKFLFVAFNAYKDCFEDWHKDRIRNDALYNKWMSTKDISERTPYTLYEVRRDLKKLEEMGLVAANRTYKNCTQWAFPIKGFKQSRFTDYYVKENSPKQL